MTELDPTPQSAPGEAAGARPRTGFYGLLNLLRGLAALMVVWAHLVGYYLEVTDRSWWPFYAVHRFIEIPMGIVENFGYLGVALFFFISGFVITHAGTRETSTEFILKRVLRIYPPLIFAILLVLFLAWFTGGPINGVDGAPFNLLDLLANFSLANYTFQPRSVLLTVAWTLAVEMMFYLLMWATRGLLAKRAWLVSPVILVVIGVLLATSGLTSSGYVIALTAVNVPLLVIGQVCYFVATKRIPLWLAAVYGVVAWGLYVWGTERLNPGQLVDGNLYPSNAVLAFLLFIVAVLAEGRLRPSRVMGVVAKRSYSLYLVHASLGLTILGTFNTYTDLPYTFTLLVALVAVAIVTEISYRFVEKPSIQLGKRVSRRIVAAKRTGAATDGAAQ
jgi:peptidoglycan/LPS O-acetylase OafA/YrhL